MKFEADIIFEEYEYLFCPELQEGHQYFKSWQEFIDLFLRYINSNTKPLYCMAAHCENNTLYVKNKSEIEVDDEIKEDSPCSIFIV